MADANRADPVALSPDETLAALYKSFRPPVDLVPGVRLSAVINATWLPRDAKAMLADNWQAVTDDAVDAEDAPVPPSFDPASAEYHAMAARLSKSAAVQRYSQLMVSTKQTELRIEAELKRKEKDRNEANMEEWSTRLENDRTALAEVEGQLADLRASFYDEGVSLTSWMSDMFALADAGLTTFDVSGRFFPHTNLQALFSANNSSSYYQAAESVLGTFKRRYEAERGLNKIQVITRLVPNQFQDGYAAGSFVEAVINRTRQAVLGADSPEPLDLVQLCWWDLQAGDVEPTLKALQKLSEDKVEVSEEGADPEITEPRKVRAIGLVDFPSRAVVQAVQAGVPIVSLSVPFSLADRRHMEALGTAREYNIKVFARDGLMGGLVSEKYLGMPCPDTAHTDDPDLDEPASVVDQVNNYGGWEKVQHLLQSVKRVADKHGVRMQTVALRWQIDQGTFPMATTRWGEQRWSQFGYNYHTGALPGLDWQLFQVDSFLDVQDMEALNKLGVLH